MCWSVRGCLLTFRGLPSVTSVTGSSGRRYSWSAFSRSITSTKGSRRVAITSLLRARVQHVGAVHEMNGLVGRHREKWTGRRVQVVEQPRVVLRQLHCGPAHEGRSVGEGELDPRLLGGGEPRRVLRRRVARHRQRDRARLRDQQDGVPPPPPPPPPPSGAE